MLHNSFLNKYLNRLPDDQKQIYLDALLLRQADTMYPHISMRTGAVYQ